MVKVYSLGLPTKIPMYDLHDYLSPINTALISDDEPYNDRQLGNMMSIYDKEWPDIATADIVLVGINEFRGSGMLVKEHAPDEVRRQLYQLHYWHQDIAIADIGNVRPGATLTDSYSALRIVLQELLDLNKTVVILGGSHDITLAQYFAYKEREQLIEATVIDATIDLRSESNWRSENFLMEMLTGEPNMVRHYNHIGFQSYFVHPYMLETIDKLRFDCYRVGVAREQLEDMEPVLRSCNLLSFDIGAIRHGDSPASLCSPNGFSGEEACSLARYAGMSSQLSTFGIYGYQAEKDKHEMTALQIAQMIWYFVDGKSRSKQEASLSDKHHFNEFHTAFAEFDTMFMQSKRTGRWWMQLPDKKMIACSYNDYLFASKNEIPERWLRAQERDA